MGLKMKALVKSKAEVGIWMEDLPLPSLQIDLQLAVAFLLAPPGRISAAR